MILAFFDMDSFFVMSSLNKKVKKENVLFVCTEDWFFKSHFLPLHRAVLLLNQNYKTILVSTQSCSSKELKCFGIELVPFDFFREKNGFFSLISQTLGLLKCFQKLQFEIIHFISLRVVIIGGLTAFLYPKKVKIYHLTGLGTLSEGRTFRMRFLASILFRFIPFYLKQPNSFLFVENSDDLTFIRKYGSVPDEKVSLIGGAGLDPETWEVMKQPNNNVPRVAFVGRMIWTKGVDVLIEAMKLLNERGVKLHLDLYGEPDMGNIGRYSNQTLDEWNQLPNVTWWGRVDDVRALWAYTNIGVVPTRTREGMPRAMLEAASCGRPQVVTDVPGPKHFIRNNIDGLIVPPENPEELANALTKLATDSKLCHQMGENARQRIFEGFTEKQVSKLVKEIYQNLLKNCSGIK